MNNLVQIKATHDYGYRNGWENPWGTIIGVEWVKNRPCYKIIFPDGLVDHWPIDDSSDPYEFRSLIESEALKNLMKGY